MDIINYCNLCNKNYTSNQKLLIHNNKYHNKIQCAYCKKEFTRLDNIKRHDNICKMRINYTNKVSNNIINNIANCDINHLTDAEINQIFNINEINILNFIELVYFNERLPTNHSFCTTNFTSIYGSIYNDKLNKIDKDQKKDIFNNILNISINKIELLLFIMYIKNLNNNYNIQEHLLRLKNIQLIDSSDIIKKEIFESINLMSYNNREMIQNTWHKKRNKGTL
jgi:hypothetical protein